MPRLATVRVLVGPLVVFGLSCGVFVLNARVITQPPAWTTFEFCQYAEIAANLVHDGRYETRLIEPMALAYIDGVEAQRSRPGAVPSGVTPRRAVPTVRTPPGPPFVRGGIETTRPLTNAGVGNPPPLTKGEPRGGVRNPAVHRARRWPVIDRYPLPSVVIAGLFWAFGASELVAAWSNGLAISVLAAVAYALARRWYGPGWGAFVAALVLLNPSFYGYFVLLGTPDAWFAVWFLLELWAWCRLVEAPDGRWGWALAAGALAALAFGSRFNALLFFAPQGAALLARRRWRALGIMAVAGLALVAPLLAYNVRHFGRPWIGVYSAWNVLDNIGAYPLEPWLYYQVPDVARVVRSHLAGLEAKIVHNLLVVVPTRFWDLWHLVLVWPLAAAGLVLGGPHDERRESTTARRFLRWSAGLFALQLLVFSALRLELEDRLSGHHGRYFFWFAVPALLLGTAALARLAAMRRRVALLLAAAVLVGQGVFYARTWSSWAQANRDEVNLGRDPIRRVVRAIVRDDQTIASDQPQITAWYSGRRSVSLPADLAELARLNAQSAAPVDYLFIDASAPFTEMDLHWLDLVRRVPGLRQRWEDEVLKTYEYALPPERTRPVGYVLLRRRGVPRSRLERAVRGER
jgi:hypothetical protein